MIKGGNKEKKTWRLLLSWLLAIDGGGQLGRLPAGA